MSYARRELEQSRHEGLSCKLWEEGHSGEMLVLSGRWLVSPRHAKGTGWSGTAVEHSGSLVGTSELPFAVRKLDDSGLLRIVDGTEQSLIT